MIDKDKLLSALEQIKFLAEEAIRESRGVPTSRRGKNARAVRAKEEANSLPGHILSLRDNAYFKEPRTIDEIHLKLQPRYHCARNRVVMALMRLSRQKKLRKTSRIVEDRKQLAYVW
jgi:hypothetical protein